LEQENGRLKKLLAERDLEIEVMKEISAKRWQACRSAFSQSGTLVREGFRSAEPVGFCAYRGR
jgi:hypothetical protein